jgi:hypothetical protein
MGNGNDCADPSRYPAGVTQRVLHDTGEMDWDCACSPMEIHVWFHSVIGLSHLRIELKIYKIKTLFWENFGPSYLN